MNKLKNEKNFSDFMASITKIQEQANEQRFQNVSMVQSVVFQRQKAEASDEEENQVQESDEADNSSLKNVLKHLDKFKDLIKNIGNLPKPEGINYDYMQIGRLFSLSSQMKMSQNENKFLTSEWLAKLSKRITGDLK